METILNSKLKGFFWREFVLLELDKLIERRNTYLAKRGINNLVQLLQRVGIVGWRLNSTVMGQRDLFPVNRENLGDLFDDSHIERKKIEKEIKDIRREIRGLESTNISNIGEWLKVQRPKYEALHESLRQSLTAQALVPKRNTLNSGEIFAYPSDAELKRKGWIKQAGSKPLKKFELTPKALALLDHTTSVAKLTAGSDDQLSEETLLRIWGDSRTILRGSIPQRSVLHRVLGMFKREEKPKPAIVAHGHHPKPIPKGFFEEPEHKCCECQATEDLYLHPVAQVIYCGSCAEVNGIKDEVRKIGGK